jgi:hypothetical protein
VLPAPKRIISVYGTKLSDIKINSIVVFQERHIVGQSDNWISGKVAEVLSDGYVNVYLSIDDSLYAYDNDDVRKIHLSDVIPSTNFLLASMSRYMYFGAPNRPPKDITWFDRQVDGEMKLEMLECRDVFSTNGHYWLVLGFYKKQGETKVMLLYRPHSLDHTDEEARVLPRLAHTSAASIAHNFPINDPSQRKYGLYLFGL